MSISHYAYAGETLADDRAILDAGRFRVRAGIATAWFHRDTLSGRDYTLAGSGMSCDEAAGLGRGVEIGVRFGARTNDAGRGLRADESARPLDALSYGGGIGSVVANPEAHVSVRVWSNARFEVDFSYRMVLPHRADTLLTQVESVSARIHFGHLVRADLGIAYASTSILGSHPQFTGGLVETPLAAWISPGRLSLGVLASYRAPLATSIFPQDPAIHLALGISFRLGPCDVYTTGFRYDVASSIASHYAMNLGFDCRL